MKQLDLNNNIASPDDFYEQLIAMHHGLSVEDTLKLNAKLLLLFANHIGDPEVLREAIAVAQGNSQNIGASA